jgi:hypothetical protein
MNRRHTYNAIDFESDLDRDDANLGFVWNTLRILRNRLGFLLILLHI